MIKYKQIDEITLDDLDWCPIWGYLSEDDPNAKDECTIKGDSEGLIIEDYCIIVKTQFQISDGNIYYGYVRPEERIFNSQPVIILNNQYIYFWNGAFKPLDDEINNYYRLLSKNKNQLFPIKWKSTIKTGKIDNGTINGFGYLKNATDINECYVV